ncbi:MAG: hypothetical protein MI923_22795 [Phycisphaerales bacterium]|nr:hypothetical protein [Phycisphaerales bacterium]
MIPQASVETKSWGKDPEKNLEARATLPGVSPSTSDELLLRLTPRGAVSSPVLSDLAAAGPR